MEASEFITEGHPLTPQFSVWQVHEDGEVVHHLVIDGKDAGVLDWETNNDGSIGYIDGLDAESDPKFSVVRDVAWLAIANCMRSMYPGIRTVEHLDGAVSIAQD